jgi:ComF family protein
MGDTATETAWLSRSLGRSLARAWGVGEGMGRMALDLCFPPHCPSCRVPVGAAGNLCAGCYGKLQHIAAPYCSCCGVPFALAFEEGLCGGCIAESPPYTQARALWVYNEVSRPLVTRIKFHDQTTLVPRYGVALARAGQAVLADAELLVPVPLHWRRLLARRYNQAALIAHAVGRASGLPVLTQALVRHRFTRPQTGLKRAERQKNVHRAFAVAESMKARMEKKRIVLIDDVMTTGATVHACVEALMKAGAAEVRVLTLARTGKE